MCKINRTIELDATEGLKSLTIQKPKPEKRRWVKFHFPMLCLSKKIRLFEEIAVKHEKISSSQNFRVQTYLLIHVSNDATVNVLRFETFPLFTSAHTLERLIII